MIPVGGEILRTGFEFRELPTRTHRLNIPNGVIAGYTDKLEAMKQAVYVILRVERYQYIIHSRNFGVELADLFGQPISFVLPEIKRRISEALLQDTRITDVYDFSFDVRKGIVHTIFTVETVFGIITAERAVNI